MNEARRIPWLLRRWYRIAGVAWVFWSLAVAYEAAARYGLSTRGRVTEATISGPVHYKPNLATYEYTVQGQRYEGEASTPNGVRFSHDLVGTRLTVTYDREQPAVSRVGNWRNRFIGDLAFSVGLVTVLALLTGALGARYVEMRARNDRGPLAGAA